MPCNPVNKKAVALFPDIVNPCPPEICFGRKIHVGYLHQMNQSNSTNSWKDGHIRVTRVKTETGELVRPVQRLYNLELQEPEISLPKDLTDSVIRTRRGRKVTTPKRLIYA
ncbi:hypothetical protein TNIN_314551 [Trichonephila inaurata madagascariensis]|uniref:DUF5641 domain-containing protein n=1 Tax=Trichonephila inaurata madagascariensis TaxID=2747483 RepID=A0A8X6MJM9_9ARAC|nr:hypothetical protein TNIN_314551 [Trichonephila inaurata madagascariensis]